MTIILLSGKQGSGKSTLQSALLKHFNNQLGGRAMAVNFADVIYEMHDAIRNIGKKYNLLPRGVKDGELLQLLGTEWGRRVYGSDVWVDCLRAKIKALRDKELRGWENPVVIIGDCRFDNEFAGISGALRVRLTASERVRQERCSAWRENTSHPSETSLDKYDEERKFDVYCDTERLSTAECVNKVLRALEERMGEK